MYAKYLRSPAEYSCDLANGAQGSWNWRSWTSNPPTSSSQVNVPVTAGNLCVFWILVFTSFKFQTPGMAYLHSLQLRCCSMGDASPFMNLGHMMTAELLCHGGFQTWPSPKSSSWLAILNVRAKGLEHPKKMKRPHVNCPAFTSQTLLSESWTSRFCRSVLLHYFFCKRQWSC